MEALDYLVDKYHLDLQQPSPFWVLCNRNTELPGMFRELGFRSGAEIGVLRGEFSERLCQSNSELQVYSVDAWQHYPVYKDFRRGWMYEPIYQQAVERLAPYPNSHIIRKWSIEAAEGFADESLDFVFLDADHRFRQFTDDLDTWGRKVRKGGIICGHDYERKERATDFVHVRYVLEAWTKAYRIHPWLVLDDHSERGWLWVKA